METIDKFYNDLKKACFTIGMGNAYGERVLRAFEADILIAEVTLAHGEYVDGGVLTSHYPGVDGADPKAKAAFDAAYLSMTLEHAMRNGIAKLSSKLGDLCSNEHMVLRQTNWGALSLYKNFDFSAAPFWVWPFSNKFVPIHNGYDLAQYYRDQCHSF